MQKKLFLTESQLYKFLLEYSREMRIPFPEDEYGKNTNLDDFLDWLIATGHYGKLRPSSINVWQGIARGYEKAAEWMGLECDSPSQFYRETQTGIGFPQKCIINDDNLMYVERAITIPPFKGISQGEFEKLIDKYENNVGGCWSWQEGSAEAYCGYGDMGSTVILKGYIRLDDIDWVETDYVNSRYYSVPLECEIRVSPNAKVEIFDVTDANGKSLIHLKNTLLVKATYFGNNSTYKGEYAKLYNSESDEEDLIDRQGNIVRKDDVIDEISNRLKKKDKTLLKNAIKNDNGQYLIRIPSYILFFDKNGDYISKKECDKLKKINNKYVIYSMYGESCHMLNLQTFNDENLEIAECNKIFNLNEIFEFVCLGDYDDVYSGEYTLIYNANQDKFLGGGKNGVKFVDVSMDVLLSDYKPTNGMAWVKVELPDGRYNFLDVINDKYAFNDDFDVDGQIILGDGYVTCYDPWRNIRIFNRNTGKYCDLPCGLGHVRQIKGMPQFSVAYVQGENMMAVLNNDTGKILGKFADASNVLNVSDYGIYVKVKPTDKISVLNLKTGQLKK